MPLDTNATGDVFLHDRLTGGTTRVSTSATAAPGDDHSFKVSVDHGGGRVAFLSFARNLSPGGDGSSSADLFVYDRSSPEQ